MSIMLKEPPQHLMQGAIAEQIAVKFLQQKGLILIETNFRCKYGEIDLIMRDDNTLVFVEVRLRNNQSYGGAGMSITPHKQKKLTHSAEYYLQKHGNVACRFDAILLSDTDINTVEWLQNAF